MNLEDRTLLVTGAAGFIGSHLAESLVERGNRVIGVDCLTDYYDPAVKQQNIRTLRESESFEFVGQNLLELELDGLLERVDAVFHLAAQAGVRASWGKEFEEYITQNIRSTQYLLESIKDHDANPPVILASSSSVYGIPDGLPMREDMKAAPYSPYGVTKQGAENLGLLYGHNFGLRVVALRYFTVYGPRQRPDMAITRFMSWLMEDEPITVFGDGSQTRDFTYVEDVVRATESVLESEVFGRVFNVGGGDPVSLGDLLDLLEDVTGKEVRRERQPERKGDVPDTHADITEIQQATGWGPSVSLSEGLRRQWEWIQDHPLVRDAV